MLVLMAPVVVPVLPVLEPGVEPVLAPVLVSVLLPAPENAGPPLAAVEPEVLGRLWFRWRRECRMCLRSFQAVTRAVYHLGADILSGPEGASSPRSGRRRYRLVHRHGGLRGHAPQQTGRHGGTD
ncbi:MAG: hypothetical protein ACLTC4_06850 [Hungatella hathewayi]